MKKAKILVVEDERNISDIVKAYLEREGFEVVVAATGKAALKEAGKNVDLIVLDLKLPDIDGEIVCKSIREFLDVPVIMLTAKSAEDDRVRGLGLGADDYVVKPFSARELVARVKAHVRRARIGEKKELSFEGGTLVINTQAHAVQKNGKDVDLTNTEFRILLTLAEKPNVVFSRLQLITNAQGYDFEGFDRVVDAHIKNIRHKIEDDPASPFFIKTMYGVGYKFIGRPDK